MNTIGSMNNFASDTQMTPKTAKQNGGRNGFEGDTGDANAIGGFEGLMAGMLANAPAQPWQVDGSVQNSEPKEGFIAVQTNASDAAAALPQTGEAVSAVVVPPGATLSTTPSADDAHPVSPSQALPASPQIASGPVAQTTQGGVADGEGSANAASVEPTANSTTPAQSSAEAIVARLAASADATSSVSSDAASRVALEAAQSVAPSPQGEKSTAAAKPATNNFATSSAAQGDTNATQQPQQSGPVSAAASLSAQPAATDGNTNKAKLVELSATKAAATAPTEGVVLVNDAGTTTQGATEIALPAAEQASRPPQLTPHTIPMLAATMMRRLESGAKQFSMRLDPPELGQVEVKLTVEANKKVRAVVSADRPEALADLVRSARELTRALHEAGLDLEENGLTFTLNDPAGDQGQNSQNNMGQSGDSKRAGLKLIADNGAEAAQANDVTARNIATSVDPFQSWQRMRVAITA